MARERDLERKRLLERGLSFACQQESSFSFDGFAEAYGDDGDAHVHMDSEELFSLLRELAGLQVRLASLMEKMGSLPLDLIRDIRQEIVEVTDQLRNINRAHRR
eukprot:TRINITY_DN7981_c0_g1_i1.p1 TRINITY_DN7981_c0_g1~~TRINITY_DN7981_c0_g1_i1.p1  ORF type:complete len:104 (-),score=17.06 TRINITY_DN7981_c0_g1_i1:168-479(-)